MRERVFGCDLGEHLLNSGNEGANPFSPKIMLFGSLVIVAKEGCSSATMNLQPAKSLLLITLNIEFDFWDNLKLFF